MALQTSGAISIDNIRTELGQAQANSSLRDLSALANFSSPDAMSEFYGYSNVTATEYTFYVGEGGVGYPDPNQSCAEAYDPITLYSSSTSLVVNVYLYTDNTLSSPFDGGDLWYKSESSVYEVRDGGRINAVRGC
jgi:hypothetical protein